MHIRCTNKLRHCGPILIHTAKVGGAIQMYAESRCACRTTYIVACTVAVHPVTGFCLGCTAAVQINPAIKKTLNNPYQALVAKPGGHWWKCV
jgi:hypothetical protein